MLIDTARGKRCAFYILRVTAFYAPNLSSDIDRVALAAYLAVRMDYKMCPLSRRQYTPAELFTRTASSSRANKRSNDPITLLDRVHHLPVALSVT